MKTPQKKLLINRLRKVANDPILQSASPDLIIGVGRHEDRRNLTPCSDQMSVELGSGHPGHLNIRDQARGIA